MQLPPFWQVTPIAVVALVVGVGYEIGLRRLAVRQSPGHRRATRRRSWAFYAGLGGLIAVVSGPLDRWAMAWLSVHMVLHVLEMFYLPPLLILGAPWVPLSFALPPSRDAGCSASTTGRPRRPGSADSGGSCPTHWWPSSSSTV